MKKLFRMIRFFFVLACFVILAFFAGRISLDPRVSPHLPDIPAMLPPLEEGEQEMVAVVAPAEHGPSLVDDKAKRFLMPNPLVYLDRFVNVVGAGRFVEMFPYADPRFPTEKEKIQRFDLEDFSRLLSTLQEYKVQAVRYNATIEVIYRFDNGTTFEKHHHLSLENDEWNITDY